MGCCQCKNGIWSCSSMLTPVGSAGSLRMSHRAMQPRQPFLRCPRCMYIDYLLCYCKVSPLRSPTRCSISAVAQSHLNITVDLASLSCLAVPGYAVVTAAERGQGGYRQRGALLLRQNVADHHKPRVRAFAASGVALDRTTFNAACFLPNNVMCSLCHCEHGE